MILAVVLAFINNWRKSYIEQHRAVSLIESVSPYTSIEKRQIESPVLSAILGKEIAYHAIAISCDLEAPDLAVPLRKLFALEVISKNETATDHELGGVSKLRTMRRIYLRGSKITDDGLTLYPIPSSAEVIDVSHSAIGDDGLLAIIKSAPDVTQLDISGTRITDMGGKEISRLARLERLSINNTRITGKSMSGIAQLSALKWLDLRDTTISDGDIGKLLLLQNLEVIDLSGTPLTASGIMRLAVLPSLETIYLPRMMAEEVQLIKLRFPSCEIVEEDKVSPSVDR